MEKQHLEKVVQIWFYGKNNFQALVSKCCVGFGTCFVITITLQEPIVPNDFENLGGEILRLSDFCHKCRHPVKHL